MASIRIRSIPPGEAPEAIRRAWVGLELPLLRRKPARYFTAGVLSRPRGTLDRLLKVVTFRLPVQRGFVVRSRVAIDILEKSNSEAARWWRENVPRMLRPSRCFLFAPECCERVE